MFRARRGQALVELALVTPIILILILGGMGVGLLLLERMQLLFAAQQAATVAAATGDCAAALAKAEVVLGVAPDSSSCAVQADYAEVWLTRANVVIVPLVPLPAAVTVSARALSASPSPSP